MASPAASNLAQEEKDLSVTYIDRTKMAESTNPE